MKKTEEDIQNEFIDTIGEMTEWSGLTRAAGLLKGLLLLSREPLSLDDMAERLEVSKGSVSTNIRLLERWKAVRRVFNRGDRKNYYQLRGDLWEIETEIVSSAPGYAIRFTGDGPFGLADLTVSRIGDQPGDVVVVRGGEMEFERCRITGAVAEYEYEERAGLWIMGNTSGMAKDCSVELNDSIGIYVTELAQPTAMAPWPKCCLIRIGTR